MLSNILLWPWHHFRQLNWSWKGCWCRCQAQSGLQWMICSRIIMKVRECGFHMLNLATTMPLISSIHWQTPCGYVEWEEVRHIRIGSYCNFIHSNRRFATATMPYMRSLFYPKTMLILLNWWPNRIVDLENGRRLAVDYIDRKWLHSQHFSNIWI